jgi:hypothetical protein
MFERFGAIGSQPIFQAFKLGLEKNNIRVTSHDLVSDAAVIWSVLWRGTMKQNHSIWQHYRNQNKPVIVLESGVLNRGELYRVGLNGINRGAYDYIIDKDVNRPKKLKIDNIEWKLSGDRIMICAQHDASEQWKDNLSMPDYLLNTVNEIRKYSNKEIVVRSHPRNRLNPKIIPEGVKYHPSPIRDDSEDFKKELANNTYAVINHSSNPGIESVLAGVPTYVSEKSLAYPVSIKRLSDLEDPMLLDKSSWLVDICHTEWTAEELTKGDVQHQLLTMIGSLT